MMATDGELVEVIRIDSALIDELIARASDLGEVKVVLQVLRLAEKRSSSGVLLDDLLEPTVVRQIAGPSSPEPGPDRLRRSVERAMADGLLLRLTLETEHGRQVHLLPGTVDNRALLDRLRAGDPAAHRDLGLPNDATLTIYRPNVFALYERFVGPLTPLIAEQLRDAERSYPRGWIEAAIEIAVGYNRRNWRYIHSILSRWEANGAPDVPIRRQL